MTNKTEQPLSEEKAKENILVLLNKVLALSEQKQMGWKRKIIFGRSRDTIIYRAVTQDLSLVIVANREAFTKFGRFVVFYEALPIEKRPYWHETIRPNYNLEIQAKPDETYYDLAGLKPWHFTRLGSLTLGFPASSWRLERGFWKKGQDKKAVKLIDNLIFVAEQQLNAPKAEEEIKAATRAQNDIEEIMQRL